jgi:hypothetical protein
MTLFAAFLLLCGWALNVAAISSCRLVTFDNGIESGEGLLYAMGLYTVEGRDGYCYVVNWADWNANIQYWTDRRMTSARVCAGVAALIGFIIMIIAWFLPCFGGGGKCIRITVGIFAMISCILAGFIFLVNTSQPCESRGCTFSQGGGLAVGAMLSYFFAACLLCVTPNPKDKEEFIPPQTSTGTAQQTVTVERTEHADGTVTVKKITTHPDGSKTVEETTEIPDVEADPGANLVDAKVN